MARGMQLPSVMRFGILLALAACGESTEERLERLLAEADIECWKHTCQDGPGAYFPKPSVPTEEGVACMNDALASGARAVSRWSIDVFNPWSTRYTYLFTIDHQVEVVTAIQHGVDAVEVDESVTCSGPFRLGPSICSARDLDSPSGFIPVNALGWDGCH